MIFKFKYHLNDAIITIITKSKTKGHIYSCLDCKGNKVPWLIGTQRVWGNVNIYSQYRFLKFMYWSQIVEDKNLKNQFFSITAPLTFF